jgi:hypothetical protein
MNNTTIQLKTKERLNKLASDDFDNLQPWMIVEAFNKGTVNWCRRQLHGLNIKQMGDEQSKAKIDDLQVLLKEETVQLANRDLFVETTLVLPSDYFEWKRISANARNECCADSRKMVIYLAEEGNVDELLRDINKQPSFEWGETFCTLKGNKVRIYTNNKFTLEPAILSYYKQPRRIEILGVVDPYTTVISTVDIESEFKDDIVELLIDEGVKILAGDIESMNQVQTATGQVEGNN